jgi:hypothetical protein
VNTQNVEKPAEEKAPPSQKPQNDVPTSGPIRDSIANGHVKAPEKPKTLHVEQKLSMSNNTAVLEPVKHFLYAELISEFYLGVLRCMSVTRF